MKKAETIFDRRLPDEDIEILTDGEPVDEEEKRLLKLLREHNTEIFEPNDRALEAPSEAEIEQLMEKTASVRPRRKAFPWRMLGLAASVVVVCGIAFFTMRVTGARRGGGRPIAPSTSSDEPAVPPVEADSTGNVNIAVTPPVSPVVSPAKPEPSRTRGVAAVVEVLSPKGEIAAATPEVAISGDPAKTYEVRVIDELDNKPVGRTVKMRGGEKKLWQAFSDAPLVADETYRLEVRLDGKIVNDPAASGFWLKPAAGRN